MNLVVHSVQTPAGARSFVAPMVEHLNRNDIRAELWFECHTRFADLIHEITVPQRHIGTDVVANPIIFWRRVARYRRALLGAGPRVVHAHMTRAALIPLLAARMAGVPIRVYHNHGMRYLGQAGPFRAAFRAFERLNLSLATHVIMVSHSNLAAAEDDRLLVKGKGIVLANGSAVGIDLEKFASQKFSPEAKAVSRARLGVSGGAFVLGYVGRPFKHKGFHRILEAWERLRLSDASSLLLVAGCSQAECDEALGHPVAGVSGLGHVADISGFYAAVDAVALPSDHEGTGYALLEGGAAGKALIGSDIPGIRCVVRHEDTGLLVKRGSLPALQSAINRLAIEAPLRERLGRNARKMVETEFSRPLVLASLLEFYQRHLCLGSMPVPGVLEN